MAAAPPVPRRCQGRLCGELALLARHPADVDRGSGVAAMDENQFSPGQDITVGNKHAVTIDA